MWVNVDHKLYVPARERHVGYMPQGNMVFPHLTVEANITYSKRGDAASCETLLNLKNYKYEFLEKIIWDK